MEQEGPKRMKALTTRLHALSPALTVDLARGFYDILSLHLFFVNVVHAYELEYPVSDRLLLFPFHQFNGWQPVGFVYSRYLIISQTGSGRGLLCIVPNP